jgi:DNA-binding NarL/FixJ family response regulator
MARRGRGDAASSARVYLKTRDLSPNRDWRKRRAADWRAVRLPAISVAVIDEDLFTRECIATSLQALGRDLEIASFAACGDCLQSTRAHDLVLYHAHWSMTHHGDDREQLACLTSLQKIAPLVILSAFDCAEEVFEAFECGANGFIPSATTSIKLAIEIIRFVRAGGTFVPMSTLLLREANRRGAVFAPPTTIYGLTPRQTEVIHRLRLGKSNKIIAHELRVSESTVKVEIHNIMKKMKATNRTEVACRSDTLAPSHGA